ncbi:MAG: flavodoxin family protein [Planctomycetes bacterium]|nr:flavodoxin family protein [Planctomycetota bacterium]
MSNQVLIINGATRINGNTDILVDRIIAGARNVGVSPLLIALQNKRISNCIGCYQCLKTSKCSFQDDMTEIRALIEDAELVVLASPLYWCGVTGLMKTFIDRLFFYYHPQTKPLITGKRALILTPMNQRDIEFESQVLVEFYKRLLSCLNVKIIEMFFFSEIMEKGAVLDRPEYLDQAYRIGTGLLNYIKGQQDS